MCTHTCIQRASPAEITSAKSPLRAHRCLPGIPSVKLPSSDSPTQFTSPSWMFCFGGFELRALQSQGVFGSEVAVTREDAKRNKLKQLASGAFKSGGTAIVLDPIVNYTTSMTNVSARVL